MRSEWKGSRSEVIWGPDHPVFVMVGQGESHPWLAHTGEVQLRPARSWPELGQVLPPEAHRRHQSQLSELPLSHLSLQKQLAEGVWQSVLELRLA